MSVIYKVITRPTDPRVPNSPKRYYPHLITLGQSVNLKYIAQKMQDRSSLSVGDIKSVIQNFVEKMKEQLLEGKSVNIEGLGVFMLTARSKGAELAKDINAKSVESVRIFFQANKELRVTKTATRADEKLDLISLDEYLKKLNMTISPNDPEKPDDGGEEGGGNEGGGSGEAPDPAAAALVGAEKAKQNPNHRGDEEYNYFMAVCFPANQLTIIDYNRVVKDLNGLTPEQFLAALDKNFIVEEKGADIYKPSGLHNFSLYLGGKWYSLTAKTGTYNDNDPIGVLDVTISSNLILDEILGIKDLRSDKRIDFVGGIRGLGELKKRVDSGEMKVALARYPVSMKQLMDIADTGNIMPPKTTWFEPKLRSGLVIHKLD